MNGRLAFYLPTGNYAVGRLANTGKNYTTTEPELGLQYFGQKNGREAVLYTGFDFNTINSATQYQSGTQFHLDGTLAQHLPLLKGLAGIGVNPFYYQQITGDSGSGATLGKFEGTTVGIGPVLSYLNRNRRRVTWTSWRTSSGSTSSTPRTGCRETQSSSRWFSSSEI